MKEINNNINERYKMRIIINKMIESYLYVNKLNSYNLLGNLNTFFIFLNIINTNNIKEELNNIFDRSCCVKINNKKIKFKSFIKKILLINLYKKELYIDLKNLKLTNRTIFIDDNLFIEFNKNSKIIKLNINNDTIITDTCIDTIDFINNENYNLIFNDINYHFTINNRYIKMAEFDEKKINYLDNIKLHLKIQYMTISLYNYNLKNENIYKYNKKYKDNNILYLIQERNIYLLLFLFLYHEYEIAKYLHLFSNLFSINNIIKINDKIIEIRDYIVKLGKINISLSNINYDIIKIQSIDEYNYELEYLLSGDYTKQYIHNDIVIREPENERITSHLIKVKIKLNEDNKICEYLLSSHNKDLTFEEIIFDNISEKKEKKSKIKKETEELTIETEEPTIETEESIIEKEESTD